MVSAVQLPQTGGGRRSSSALGREVVAQALSLDPAAAARAGGESSWRTGYLPHFRALVEAGLAFGPRRRPAPGTWRAAYGDLQRTGPEADVDDDLHSRIDELVAEEHALRARHAEGLGEQELDRLRRLEEKLDATWDLLRQRQARREAGQDPATAQERPPGVVEGYLS